MIAGEKPQNQIALLEKMRKSSNSLELTIELENCIREIQCNLKKKERENLKLNNVQSLIRKAQMLLQDDLIGESRVIVNMIRDNLYHQLTDDSMELYIGLVSELTAKEQKKFYPAAASPPPSNDGRQLVNKLRLLIASGKIAQAKILADKIINEVEVEEQNLAELERIWNSLREEENYQQKFQELEREHSLFLQKFQNLENFNHSLLAEKQKLENLAGSLKGENYYKRIICWLLAYTYQINPAILPERCREQLRMSIRRENEKNPALNQGLTANISEIIWNEFDYCLKPFLEIINNSSI